MKIYVVMVTYNPNLERLNLAINSLEKQVDRIFVVNNSNYPLNINLEKLILIELGENKGIAFAQNKGIEKSIELCADYVLLSDQDTIYPDNFISDLLKSSKNLEYDALCPVFFDETKQENSPIMLTKFKYIYRADKPLYVEHAIASGTLIKTETFQQIGCMNEQLFIDYVDFEWCWRLKQFGGKLLCCPDVVIKHQLGDDYKRILGKKVCIRSDFRYYYMIRNGFQISFFYPFLTLIERLLLVKKTILLCLAVILLRKNIQGFKTVIKGIKTGLKNQHFFSDL